ASTTARTFDPSKLSALEKLQNHVDEFDTDDELGVYIETSMRPTPNDPQGHSNDKSTGVHNYLHNRFSDAHSKIDLGDPSVNLKNKRFWRLHGWIEARWTEFRTKKGLGEDDPDYADAIKKAEDMLTPPLRLGGPRDLPPPEEAPPDSLRKF